MPFERIAQDVNVDELSPLNVKCTNAKCEDHLHCYRQKQNMNAAQNGKCWACGIALVDWTRIHKKDLTDVAYTFEMLKTELVRHVYWHTKIDQRATNHALRKGKQDLRFTAEKRLRKYIANSENPWEGRQTPKQGNIIFYAQHATACCCRKCMEYWHNIPMGIELSDEQINYFVELIMLYIADRMPELQEKGIKIRPIRSNGKF